MSFCAVPNELSTPIRASWDLPAQFNGHDDPERIAGELLACGLLLLEVREPTAALRPATRELLKGLVPHQRAVSLTLTPAAVDRLTASELRVLALAELLVYVESVDQVEALVCGLERLRTAADTVGVSLRTSRENLRALPGILELLSEGRIHKLVLPIPRAGTVEASAPLADAERAQLRDELRASDFRSVGVTVHDPFLWDVLFPDVPHHGNGCHAATTMIHVTPQYDVLPCSILPVSLGNLRESSLRKILESPKRAKVRAELRPIPADCEGCSIAPGCRGGCRGRAYLTAATLRRRDPACATKA